MTISLPEAAVVAAEWDLDTNGLYQTNGALLTGLGVGSHTVTFSNILGWNTPAPAQVTITNGETTTNAAVYTLQTGSLQVTLAPSGAVTAGATWSVDGGAAQASGAVVSGLSVLTNHTVSFVAVAGFNTPGGQSVSVTNNETNSIVGNYVQQTVLVSGPP